MNLADDIDDITANDTKNVDETSPTKSVDRGVINQRDVVQCIAEVNSQASPGLSATNFSVIVKDTALESVTENKGEKLVNKESRVALDLLMKKKTSWEDDVEDAAEDLEELHPLGSNSIDKGQWYLQTKIARSQLMRLML